MINDAMTGALNAQVNAELYSSYLYLGMSAWADAAGYKGVSGWMAKQAREELEHAMKIYEHIKRRGGVPVLADVKAEPAVYEGLLPLFEKVLAHERKVSGLIGGIAELALSEKDYATFEFIQWFVREQVEEEDSAGEIIQKLKLTGGSAAALVALDGLLGQR
ncbi:MAG: ferritin [Clostridiales bacterium]|nr:ferritin [Clostridiales bacterium]